MKDKTYNQGNKLTITQGSKNKKHKYEIIKITQNHHSWKVQYKQR